MGGTAILGAVTSTFGLLALAVEPDSGMTPWVVVALAVSTIGFAMKAMIAERKAATTAQIKASSHTMDRLCEIEDERAQMGKNMIEVLTKVDATMQSVARSMDVNTTSMRELIQSIESHSWNSKPPQTNQPTT